MAVIDMFSGWRKKPVFDSKTLEDDIKAEMESSVFYEEKVRTQNDIEDAHWAQQMSLAVKGKDLEATYYGHAYPIVSQIYDSEKSMGQLGPPVDYTVSYSSISARSWQAYLESDIAKIIVNTHVEWVVGPGLSLQAKPSETVINDSGIELDLKKFTEISEGRFRLHAKSRNSSHNRMDNLHTLARKAYKSAIIGGDVLILFRYERGSITAELIDGRHIGNPTDSADWLDSKKKRRKIIHGVEIDKSNGAHIAYHVKQRDGKYKRHLARGPKSDRLQAILFYGDEYRIGEVRGVPLYHSSIEKMKKIDRYIEAMVSAAEQRANIAYYISKNHFSDGETIMQQGAADAFAEAGDGGNYVDAFQTDTGLINEASRKIYKTTHSQLIDLPPNTEIKTIESSIELKLGEFTTSNFIYICASVGIPYEVALMKYENSFSASRMASQTWGQIIKNKRSLFNFSFYLPFYDLWLSIEILTNRIQAVGYIAAMASGDNVLVEAFHQAHFIGHGVPQADPTKEVKASIMRIQGYLSNFSDETETLGGGDFEQNIKALGEQYARLMDKIPLEYQTPPNAESDRSEVPKDPSGK